jgi:hypothetical protein
MSKRVPFTQHDITRLLKGALAAGTAVRRVEIDRVTGNLIAEFTTPTKDGALPDEDDDWDTAISAWRKRRASAQGQ